MNHTLAPAGDHGRGRRDPIRTAIDAFLLIVVGVTLGLQYVTPNKRVLPVLVGLVLFGVIWRIDMLAGLAVMVLALPYPKGTVFGNTNLAFILLLLITWLLRATQRQSPGLARSPLDAAVMGLLIAYIVSFYNIAHSEHLGGAFQNFEILLGGVMVYFLVVSNVRTERDLKRLHAVQLVSVVSVCLLALYELNHPGGVFIRGWIEFGQSTSEDFARHNVRVGGPFGDYELLSEYCAINLLLVVLWLVRAKSTVLRVLLGGTLLLVVFTQFTTVTRGGMISLGAALIYLTWVMRRHVRVVPFTIILSAIVAGFLFMNYYVANYTRSGDLLSRFEGTEFVGVVPDNRREAWADGWERFLRHPFIGHGPYYSYMEGTRRWLWPHNGYLYIANLVGLFGLSFFLWILARLWSMTRGTTDTLSDPSYARSYLLVAHMQLILFFIDQTKIDFLRNDVYHAQVWMMFAYIAAAYGVLQRERASIAQPAR